MAFDHGMTSNSPGDWAGCARLWTSAILTHLSTATNQRAYNFGSDAALEVERSRKWLLEGQGRAIAFLIGFDGDAFQQRVEELAAAGWPKVKTSKEGGKKPTGH